METVQSQLENLKRLAKMELSKTESFKELPEGTQGLLVQVYASGFQHGFDTGSECEHERSESIRLELPPNERNSHAHPIFRPILNGLM